MGPCCAVEAWQCLCQVQVPSCVGQSTAHSHPQEWADIICRLVWKAVTTTQPWRDASEESSMDIRHYVKIKTMHGGDKHESAYCRGVGVLQLWAACCFLSPPSK